jgi:hypothetical protein
MQILHAIRATSLITLQHQILRTIHQDFLLPVNCAIHLTRDGNLPHIHSTTRRIFQFIPDDTKEHGIPVPSAIQIHQTILFSAALHATSIIKPIWIKNTGKRMGIHTTALPVTVVIPMAGQRIDKFL